MKATRTQRLLILSALLAFIAQFASSGAMGLAMLDAKAGYVAESAQSTEPAPSCHSDSTAPADMPSQSNNCCDGNCALMLCHPATALISFSSLPLLVAAHSLPANPPGDKVIHTVNALFRPPIAA